MNFKFLISNFNLPIMFGLLMVFFFVPTVYADAVTDNGLNFLKSKQAVDGRITTGFSAPSQWSAIAFAVSDVDVSTVKAADISLLDFLLSDVPVNDAATDWETRILAIVAVGQNPTNFNGTNYVSHLESFYNNGQIGEVCSLNDDIFGLLALLASGNTATLQAKQDVLNFLITKQDASDGGFGFSAPGCAWYSTSADMTGAAIQALVAAKNAGLSHADLDTSIDRAKAYLFANQNADGGFGYFGSSDPDTTGWVLQAFNVLGLANSGETASARNYLLAQQSEADGGFMAYDWGTGAFVSNATTTAQAIIALSGKGWMINVFDPASQAPTGTPIPTVSNAPSPAVTPTATQNNSSSNSPTATPTPTVAPTLVPTITTAVISSSPNASPSEDQGSITRTASTPEEAVLGASDKAAKETLVKSSNEFLSAGIFAGLGFSFIFIYIAKHFVVRKLR